MKYCNYVCKLDMGVLALLWCSGSQKSRARLLNKLINPKDKKHIRINNKELEYVFKKLIYFSIDLPEQYIANIHSIKEA